MNAIPTAHEPAVQYRILSLDGGGAKGFYSLGVLKGGVEVAGAYIVPKDQRTGLQLREVRRHKLRTMEIPFQDPQETKGEPPPAPARGLIKSFTGETHE